MEKHKPHRFAHVEKEEEEIGSYMSSPVHSVDSATTIKELTEIMESKNIGSLLVTENGEFIGIVTERDLARKVIGKNIDSKTAKVSAIMTQPLLTLEGKVPVTEANKFMAEHKIRHLAVTENGKVVGMLSVRDLVSFFANPRLRH